ncbi:hypothetical protein [Arsenicibacter rosenii]|uniref:Uncharacterized protein n=1 Tax=Arsenicibacter rosenii TaxID=1750698 RepID=A0A1S2VME6_9BACT|nr:hypothetical protein [Arsenicibacter rosenii]OIN59941.1 hypothetical protein BLX24_08870 [Arsenicibacter rosenii]
MKHLTLTDSPIFPLSFAVQARPKNSWLDSTQINRSNTPLCLANGIIVNPAKVNPDFVTSVNVVNDEGTRQRPGQLTDHGCIIVDAGQQQVSVAVQPANKTAYAGSSPGVDSTRSMR